MAAAIPIMMVASTIFSAAGKMQQGADADRAAQFQAAQLEQRAQSARASAQREAQEQRRHAALANSALQARAGGGGLDPTIVDLSTGIAGEGEYRALTAMYEGEEQARGAQMGAEARRFEGKAARRAGEMGAVSSVFGGGMSLFQKYGG